MRLCQSAEEQREEGLAVIYKLKHVQIPIFFW